MHDVVKKMLSRYDCSAQQDYINAIKEIFQEIALLGLWRAKFYEKAAFYGGSALRILYGLDRFSEDLDFTLLQPNSSFDLTPYNKAIAKELEAFGFEATVESKVKIKKSSIQSAFIKADSQKQLITIQAPAKLIDQIHHMHTIKIKMEVDINPPADFQIENKFLLQPIAFSIKSLTKPSLFAGKIHAILCRPWTTRVKGRDWYDLVWYLASHTSVNLQHLQARLIQSNLWAEDRELTLDDTKRLLKEKIAKTDFVNAKKDILPFIVNSDAVEVWSKPFFIDMVDQLTI